MRDQLDYIFSTLGTGYWNWLHYVAIGYAVSLPSPHALAGAFVAPRLKFECRLPPDNDDTIFLSNDTDSDEACSFFSKSQNGTLNEESCTEWDFDNSTFKETLTSEFGLVCERDYLRATYQSMYMIGVLAGSPLNGILADRFGRRLTFVYACILFSIMTNLSFLLPNLPSVLTFRFLVGTMHTALLKTGYILAMEITNPKVRSLVGITLFLPWALGTMAWGGLAYLERRWRYLVMSASLPSLALLPVIWFMDESPRWLVVKGKYDQALEVLKKAAKWNQVTLPSDQELLKLMMENEASREGSKVNKGTSDESWKNILKSYVSGVIVLFRTPRLRVASTVMHLNCLVLGMVYFGLSLSGGNFNFNMFSYMALMGLVEVPAYTVLAPVVSRFGRRMPVSVCYLMSGMVLLLQPFLPSGHQWLIISSAMLGKMAISMSFQGNNLYASELFPTEVRTRGVSSSFMMSRIGSSVSPFITEYLGPIYPWAPSVVFGIAAAIAGFATLVLWETLSLALPDTILQLESPDFKATKTYTKTSRVSPQEATGSSATKL
ncbi:organic cation transporter protein-like [Macrobrachium rosenbergii]|uniref:organic cation transporter protein-like n=1 Tax=Macrobrachium rosenbergii TaxID=79674 RepID=UPI0034D4405E